MNTTIDADIRSAMVFRLLFGTQDDRYERETAEYVLSAVTLLDNTATVVITRGESNLN